MLSKVNSGAVAGIDGILVEVETDISYGLPVFNIVGLPQTAVRESKERVKTAINNCGYTFPMDRVTINLAPADIKKQGTGLDLPVAVGILAASGIIDPVLCKGYLFIGELSLDGKVKKVDGILPITLAAVDIGMKGIIIPFGNRHEASVVKNIDIIAVKHLCDIVNFFSGHRTIDKYAFDPASLSNTVPENRDIDFSEVQGQNNARQALEIAAAGGHNFIMTGPPGSGKSMMAKRIPTILPDLSFDEAIEVTKIYSVMGLVQSSRPLITERPFRSPHHTISDAGLVGGGSRPEPGEISLAHHGVLFLDELPEFKKNVLEVLRQPLEDGKVTIARAGFNATYPSRIMLVAAMNPCPCGYFGDPSNKCTCSVPQIQKYRAKISGPLLDRIDIQIEVPKVAFKDLIGKASVESSFDIRKRVMIARKIQDSRFEKDPIFCNAQMQSTLVKNHCRLDTPSERILEHASRTLGFSARAFHSILKVARTIADLDEKDSISSAHIAQAIQYRNLDRNINL